MICCAKSIFHSSCGVRTGGGCCATADRSGAAPTGAAYVDARAAQLVAAAEIHESRWCGKPLFIVGWNGKARRTTCQVPPSSCVSSRNRSPRLHLFRATAGV